MSNTHTGGSFINASEIKPVSDQESISVNGKHITLHKHGSVYDSYSVELNNCNTPEKILDWVMHLSEKTWMTTLMIRGFIRAACEANNIKIDHSV